MPLFLYEDARARAFSPFALTRPVAELRAGAVLVRHRWESAFGAKADGFVGPAHLADFEELDAPSAVTTALPAGSVVANSRCVLSLGALTQDVETWTCDGRVAAVRLARAVEIGTLRDGALPLEELAGAGGETTEVPGRWLDDVWHLIRDLPAQLAEDIEAVGPRLTTAVPHGAIVIGERGVYVEEGAVVEPHVVFDVTAGPVLVLRGASVRAFTRLTGPLAVGEGSTILGGDIAASSIGDLCKVRGEMSNTIVLGHSNKGHDGFVGHSYLGRWVNLGAGTTTSNLKNTYGTVQLWTPQGQRDTGMQFLGTMFGDHAKTGIGLRLTTGTVLGAGANVWDRMPPKYVEPFSWGGGAPYARYAADKFLGVAERMMSRRHVELGERCRRQLRTAHAAHRGLGEQA
jgi:UDP-N-acetylglucosamine diphosphorylase/glucosamine-1-phosphate N-acetyltransferase